MSKESLQSHLEELKKRHRTLDEEIIALQTHHISAEVRQLKTQKLWLKDEIHRIEQQLHDPEYLNGS
jgi:hypothetical protein